MVRGRAFHLPLGLNGQVSGMRVGTEKHPGIDDAYVITLDDARELRIDGDLFHALAQGDQLSKQPGKTDLKKNGQPMPLAWSRDVHGLLWCMMPRWCYLS